MVPTAGRQREVLTAFGRSLRREAGALARRPEIAWQQLFNDLQWADGGPAAEALAGLLGRALAAREARDQGPWLRRLTPPARSDALVAMLRADGDVSSCAFSPDGRYLVSGASGGVVEVWDHGMGRRINALEGRTPTTDPVSACAFSPDGASVIAAYDGDHLVRVWETSTGTVLRAFLFGNTTRAFAFSPDLTRIVASTRGSHGGIWNAGNGEPILMLEGSVHPPCAFSPDGRRVVMGGGSEGGSLGIWDAGTGEQLVSLRWRGTGMDALVQSCAFSPNGRLLASAGYDGTLRLWDAGTGLEVACLICCDHAAGICVFSPDGTRLASTAGREGAVTLWDVESRSPIATVEDVTWRVDCLAFSPDGTRLAVGGGELVRIWDVSDPAQLQRRGRTDPFSGAAFFAFSRQGDRLLTTSGSELRVRDAADGRELAVCEGHTDTVFCCAFSRDGRRIVSGGMDESVRVWDATCGRQLDVLAGRPGMGHAGPVECCAFSPDGSHVVSASLDETVRIWSLERPWYRLSGWLPVTVLTGHEIGVQACDWSPDGRRIVSGGSDATVRLWDAKQGRELAVLEGHSDPVNVCVFSPDGSLVASCADDGTVRLWDVERARQRAVLEGHGFAVKSCAFSTDGTLLVSAGDDMTIRVWDVVAATQLSLLVAETRVQSCAFRPGVVRPTVVAGMFGSLTTFELHGWAPRPRPPRSAPG